VDIEWIEAQVDNSWPLVVVSEHEDSIKLNISALLALPLSLQRHLVRRVTAQLCAGQSPLELRHYVLIEQLLQRARRGQERTGTPSGGQVMINHYLSPRQGPPTATLHLPGRLQAGHDFKSIVF